MLKFIYQRTGVLRATTYKIPGAKDTQHTTAGIILTAGPLLAGTQAYSSVINTNRKAVIILDLFLPVEPTL